MDVTQVHIDGCIYACPANLTFAERMADLGAQVRVPTTTNAISVDRDSWEAQGVPPAFGGPAARLADAYVRMGCRPTFTCAPYLLDSAPKAGEFVGWAESNAVVFANSVIGARTAKRRTSSTSASRSPGGRPLAGVYLDENRKARRVIDVERPDGADDPSGRSSAISRASPRPTASPSCAGFARVALARRSQGALRGLRNDLGRADAAYRGGDARGGGGRGAGRRPRRDRARRHGAAWASLNAGPESIDLVAIGSPHASLTEIRALADALGGAGRAEAST